MQTGIVDRFNKIKGYGFITPDNSKNKIFVHFSQIVLEGYKELKPGQCVSFEVQSGERGEFATQVVVVESKSK